MKHCIGYLKATQDYKRKFFFENNIAQRYSNQLVTLVDAAFASDEINRSSTSGFIMFYNSSLVAANSTTQSRIAISAPEAELNEIYRSSKKLLHYDGMFRDFGERNVQSTILTDSSSSINTVYNPVSARYKFLAVRIHFLKQQVQIGKIRVIYMRRWYNLADLMTKQNSPQEFSRLWTMAQSPFRWVHTKHRLPINQDASMKGVRSQSRQPPINKQESKQEN